VALLQRNQVSNFPLLTEMSSAEQPALGEADMDKATAVDDDKPTFHVVHSDSGGPAAGLALWQAQDIGVSLRPS
jgi:hypothetical protein